MRYLITSILVISLAACSSGQPEEGDIMSEPIRITSETAADMSMTDMADQLISDGQSLTDLLSTVNSAETAEAIRTDLEGMMSNYQVILERFESMGEPSFTEMAALASRLPDLNGLQQSLSAEVERIYKNHPEATDVLRETLEGFGRSTTP